VGCRRTVGKSSLSAKRKQHKKKKIAADKYSRESREAGRVKIEIARNTDHRKKIRVAAERSAIKLTFKDSPRLALMEIKKETEIGAQRRS